ncbi:MAG: iron ABC transporter permease [Bacillota bacterium]|nr:iron ABC transporter permease [Bacillota bacterium]
MTGRLAYAEAIRNGNGNSAGLLLAGRRQRRRQLAVLGVGCLLFLAAFTLGVGLGPVRLGPVTVWEAILGRSAELPRTIVWNIRLPRALIGSLVGAGLAVSGALLQGVMRNPLADPHIIGVSAGAGLGAVTVMTLFPLAPPHWIPAAAFAGALLGAAIVYTLAWRGGIAPMRMILAGVAVSSLFSAGTSALLVTHSDNVQAAMTWLIGGLAGRGWSHWQRLWPYIVTGVAVSLASARKVNLLLLGDDLAAGLGVRVERVRLLLIALAAVMAGAAVSVAGLIGFIGLIVPHLTRLLLGSDYRFLLPTSAVLGGALLIAADTAARIVADPVELPVGILTAAMGAPFFLYLLRRRSTR